MKAVLLQPDLQYSYREHTPAFYLIRTLLVVDIISLWFRQHHHALCWCNWHIFQVHAWHDSHCPSTRLTWITLSKYTL